MKVKAEVTLRFILLASFRRAAVAWTTYQHLRASRHCNTMHRTHKYSRILGVFSSIFYYSSTLSIPLFRLGFSNNRTSYTISGI